MIPLVHPSATRAPGAPRNWDEARHGSCCALPIADVDVGGRLVMESLWRPSAEELAALNVGGAVILQVGGTQHPVVAVGVCAPEVGRAAAEA